MKRKPRKQSKRLGGAGGGGKPVSAGRYTVFVVKKEGMEHLECVMALAQALRVSVSDFSWWVYLACVVTDRVHVRARERENV